MRKDLTRFVSALALVLMSIAPVAAAEQGAAVSSPKAAVDAGQKELTIALLPEGSKTVQRIPLFSEKYADTAVAMVNGEPITVRDFTMQLASMHSNMTDSAKGKQDYTQALDRLIAVKLVKQEALNIGFDRTPEVRKQIDEYALKTMIQLLLANQVKDLKVEQKEVEEMYQQMAIEVKLLTYRFLDQKDAEAVLKQVKDGGNFKQLAEKMVKSKKAQGGEDPKFARLNDLLPQIAKAVFPMKTGDVSEIFKDDKGYLVFQLEKRRVYEDAETHQAAADRVLQQKSRKKQIDYLKSLQDKYVKFDKEAEKALDFAAIIKANPNAKGTEVFEHLSGDQRVLATITMDNETVKVTVGEIADALKTTMYHGLDRVIDANQLDSQKDVMISNKFIAITGKLEAQAQGIDKSENFRRKMEDFEDQLLFNTFMTKAVVPGITIKEEAVKKYYDEHLGDFSSPLMLKMQSLAFTDADSAQDAYKKLQAGSDFKWVAANSTGLAAADNKDVLGFNDQLLSVTALPEGLHHEVENARQGDLFLYHGDAGLTYVLQVTNAYPPVAKDYTEVRQEIGRILYADKINDALADWVAKLKEAYETKNFLVEEQG